METLRQDLWSPYKEGITQSFLHSFLKCKEQTRLRYLEGWRKEGGDGTSAKEYGNVCHYVASEANNADEVKDVVA